LKQSLAIFFVTNSNTTQQGNLFFQGISFPRKVVSKEFYFQGIFLEGMTFQGIFQNTWTPEKTQENSGGPESFYRDPSTLSTALHLSTMCLL
jgi:hypothetical protein